MNDAPAENGFFRWVRELKMYRGTDHWIGGVATGIAQRFDLSPILVRGIFVALSCFAGLGLLVYGIAWALLPDTRGTIHAQQALAGHWSSGMSGALAFFIVGSIGFPAFFSWWDGGFWTFLVIAAIIFVLFSRRGRFAETGTRSSDDTGPWNTEKPTEGYSATVPGATSPGFSDSTKDSSPASATARGSDLLPFSAQFAQANAASPSEASSPVSHSVPTPENTDLPTAESTPAGVGPTTQFQPLLQEHTMSNPPSHPADEAPTGFTSPPMDPHFREPRETSFDGSFTPPVPGTAVKVRPTKSLPGYVTTIIVGLAIVVFALIVGLNQLNMLDLPTSAVAVALACVLVIIALGIIGASLKQRTGGALIGFGIAALVLSLIFSGGALRGPNLSVFSHGITTVDETGTTNVFHSGTMDLLNYSSITQDTTLAVDNVFTSLTMIVPDNIPVVLQSDGAFSSLKINGSSSSISGGSTRINPTASGPTLYLDLDGAFNSVEISVQKAEVAP